MEGNPLEPKPLVKRQASPQALGAFLFASWFACAIALTSKRQMNFQERFARS